MADNIVRVRIFGVDIVVMTPPDQPSQSYLRAFTPETASLGGGGITLGFLEEKYVQEKNVDTSSRLSILDDDGDVDTTLRLSTTSVSRSCGSPVLCPMPLRSFPPGIIPEAEFWLGGYDDYAVEVSATDQVDKTVSLSHATGSGICDEKREKSRKRKQDKVGDEKKTSSVKRRRDNAADDQDLHPIPSLEDIPGLLQVVESRNGTRPVFLYGKRLEESDVSGHHNRLFVTRREKFTEFLTDVEKAALNHSKEGLEVFAVDPQGKLYKLGFKIWQSLKMMVVNSDWNKLVVGNNAQKGDWIQIWGYRENEKLGFAINFRKSDEA